MVNLGNLIVNDFSAGGKPRQSFFRRYNRNTFAAGGEVPRSPRTKGGNFRRYPLAVGQIRPLEWKADLFRGSPSKKKANDDASSLAAGWCGPGPSQSPPGSRSRGQDRRGGTAVHVQGHPLS